MGGERKGQGILLYSNGNIYEGEWDRNLRQGRGRYLHTNGYVQVTN